MGFFDQAFRRMNYQLSNIFGGRRNLYEVFGYDTNPGFDNRYMKYMRQGIAARIVDAPAAALWTNPPLVTSTSDSWNEMWDDLIARYNLWNNIERLDKLAGIGRFSILIIGYNDGGSLETPVNTRSITQKERKILYLQPYSERTATIKQYNLDPRSEDFMKPEIYEIQPMDDYIIGWNSKFSRASGSNVKANRTFRVHASRVLHIAENILENGIFGMPRLERVYNTLDDLLKVTGGTAETFWLTANRGLHIDIDKEMELDAQDEKNLADEIDEYTNQLRRVIRTRGTKVSALGSDTPDPTGVYQMLISELSGSTGIPRRILTGSEAGQLASDQDRANWADRIDERRANWGNPIVLFQLIKKLTNAGYLPADSTIQITVDWPSSFKMSPLENAQTSAQHARSATNFAKAIETMENLKRGEPGSPDTVDPATGETIPGKAAVEGSDVGDLITVDEARSMLGLDKAKVTFDSGDDVMTNPTRKFQRRVTVSLGRIMKM